MRPIDIERIKAHGLRVQDFEPSDPMSDVEDALIELAQNQADLEDALVEIAGLLGGE